MCVCIYVYCNVVNVIYTIYTHIRGEYFLLKNGEEKFSFSAYFYKLVSSCTNEKSSFVDLRRTRSTGESRESCWVGFVVSCSRKSPLRGLSGCDAISPGEKVLCIVIRASFSCVPREAWINFNPRSNFVRTRFYPNDAPFFSRSTFRPHTFPTFP